MTFFAFRFGKPLYLSQKDLEEYRADKKSAVKKLTKQMEEVLWSLTLNSPDWETMRLLHLTRRIFMGDTKTGLAEYVEITRR